MIYLLFRPLVWFVLRGALQVLGRPIVAGRENVPRQGPVLLCPNHVSDADPPTVFGCLPRKAWYLGKSELFAIPVVGRFFVSFRGIPIKRDTADRAALRRAEQLLRDGHAVVVFPEGRCSRSGSLQELQSGAALLSLRTGAPIVPVGLTATNQILPYGAVLPRPSRDRVRIAFGTPLYPESLPAQKRGEALKALDQRLEQSLRELTGQ